MNVHSRIARDVKKHIFFYVITGGRNLYIILSKKYGPVAQTISAGIRENYRTYRTHIIYNLAYIAIPLNFHYRTPP